MAQEPKANAKSITEQLHCLQLASLDVFEILSLKTQAFRRSTFLIVKFAAARRPQCSGCLHNTCSLPAAGLLLRQSTDSLNKVVWL